MTGTDPALKPRLRRRSTFEYVAWVLCSLIGVGILLSVSTNPNFRWGVVAQYFTHETILRGLMLTTLPDLCQHGPGNPAGTGPGDHARPRASNRSRHRRYLHHPVPRHPGAGPADLLVQHLRPLPEPEHRDPVHGHRHRDRHERPDGTHHRGPGRPDPERGRLHGRDHPRRVLLGRQGPDRGRRLPRA